MIKNIVVMLLCSLSFAQFEQDLKFTGVIITADSITFPYEINVSKSFYNYSGFSISDKGGASETKTVFKVSKVNEELFFSEDRISYTKANYDDFDDFCLVNFKIKEKELLKSKKITVDFAGKFTDGSTCINGKLRLISTSFIEKRFAKAEKKINNNKIIRKKLGDSLSIIKNKLKTQKEKLLNNTEVSLNKNDKLTFSVNYNYKLMFKDYSLEDGDRIKITVNDQYIEYIDLTKTPVFINFNAKMKYNKIEILGISEGRVKSITSLIEIQDKNGQKKKAIRLSLNSDEKATLIISK